MIKSIIIAAKFLKRQLVLNLIIIVEILISVMLLTEMFVYIFDRIDNQRTAYELYNDDLFVFEEFEYYYENEENIINKMKTDPAIEKVGKIDVMECMLDDRYLYLGLYNSDMSNIYSPKISKGSWFSTICGEYEACPAVVSSDIGLRVGSVVEILVADTYAFEIQVVGILASPTQYLLPTGMSDSVDSLISQHSVVLLDCTQIDMSQLSNIDKPDIKALFLLTDMTKDQLVQKYNKYGSVQSINDMIEKYTMDSNELILSEMLLFTLFSLLAFIAILSAEVVHSMNCRKTYTVYYLLGMEWKKCVWVELGRHIVLLFAIIAMSILMDRYGMLQTAWLSNCRHAMLYVILVIYLIGILCGSSIAFMYGLLRDDISVSLKMLNGGE